MLSDILSGSWVFGIGGSESVANETWDNVIDETLKRVRDPEGKMHSRDFVGDLLLECMRLVNLSYGLVVSSATLTTVGGQIFYPIDEDMGGVSAWVVGVRDGNRDLKEVPWRNFLQVETEVLNQRASKPTTFSNIGRDLLAIWPPKPAASSVTVKFIELLTKPSDLSERVDLAPEYMVEVVALAEQALLIRARAWEVLRGGK